MLPSTRIARSDDAPWPKTGSCVRIVTLSDLSSAQSSGERKVAFLPRKNSDHKLLSVFARGRAAFGALRALWAQSRRRFLNRAACSVLKHGQYPNTVGDMNILISLSEMLTTELVSCFDEIPIVHYREMSDS